ncbi:glycoside hydrolase family 16 protein [Hyphomicrobium sp.]|uniref:glycoside hydrolase family 16 protein n=1 Tax=Hyphomicrobium sp. TaxID=82 RepID=UPI002E34E171|nr:glycoside hydrolase family 16 protein [Hyphomicrobium sp.]HEX2840199.1 glycoside hydrolase family 16 protein [Hyphomicrobium sp.]
MKQSAKLYCTALGLIFSSSAWALAGCHVPADVVAGQELFETFKAPLNECVWTKVQSNWGGLTATGDYSGGVLLDNIQEGTWPLVLHAYGNRYNGPIRGLNSDDSVRPDGRRTGAAIMTRQRFLGGRFEVRATVPDALGVVSAFWTYNNFTTRDGVEHNHEIDIEFPGRPRTNAPPSLKYVMLTTWTGLKDGQSTSALERLPASVTDGKYHVLRFDWLPPSDGGAGYVKFFIDGALLTTTTTNVPSEPGNVWLGLWFPPEWAGTPDFDSVEMKVDWVRISPLQAP